MQSITDRTDLLKITWYFKVKNKINKNKWDLAVALPRGGYTSTVSSSNWNLACWVLWREENRRTRRKTLGAGTRTNNKLNPHVTPGPGIEPGPQRWEACALSTAPSLLQQKVIPGFRIPGFVFRVSRFPGFRVSRFPVFLVLGQPLNFSLLRNRFFFNPRRVRNFGSIKLIFPNQINAEQTNK